MLIHNKYLEELGVDEDTYPLGNSCDHETELDEKMGVVVCQTWNLNLTLAMELYTYIKAFRDIRNGCPCCCKSQEEWDAILDEIAEGFADFITDKNMEWNSDMRKFNRSMNLLKKYWLALWW